MNSANIALRSAMLLALLVPTTVAQQWSDSKIHETLLPDILATDLPPDHWQCVVANLTQYFDPPKPTGSLFEDMLDYGEDIFNACSATAGDDAFYNCRLNKEQWCAYTTAAPKPLASDLSSWGSAASSWWSANSAIAVSLAEECPIGWYDAMYGVPTGAGWLNATIMYAACHAEAHGTAGAAARQPTSTAAKPGSAPTGNVVGATQVPEVNGARRARGGIFV